MGRANAQNVVEYGLLMATIAIIVLMGITAFGQVITPWFASLAGRITTLT
jgi:Flp pilus assembly pilin Flp